MSETSIHAPSPLYFEDVIAQAAKDRLARQQEKEARARDRAYSAKSGYRLLPGQRETLDADCKGCCLICKTPFSKIWNEQKNVDHCHRTGKVRGFLCRQCNFGLGVFRDNPKLLRSAARYLEKHSAGSLKGK